MKEFRGDVASWAACVSKLWVFCDIEKVKKRISHLSHSNLFNLHIFKPYADITTDGNFQQPRHQRFSADFGSFRSSVIILMYLCWFLL